MLIFLISCFSFLLLSHPFLKPHPSSKSGMWTQLHTFFLNKRRIFTTFSQLSTFSPSINTTPSPKFETIEPKNEPSLLNLPDLALDCILEKLSPLELCKMAGVCSSLKQRCTSDYFWIKHMNKKWGSVIGDAALKEWQMQITSDRNFLRHREQRRRLQFFNGFLNFLWSKTEMKSGLRNYLPVNNSVMSFYVAIETGKFWFPAQVFNREVQNGSVGFMLSCYDAHLCYESTTDNFIARYTAQGRRMIEADIEWSRIRAPSVDTSAEDLHISDYLHELKPDDHIEIQWRKNKEFPYGWWYGVVGHLESCNGNKLNCHCHATDSVILEFKQYSSGSRWRKTLISRINHREVGNERDGFYGGIRKLYKEEEIAKWKHLWPNCTLD